MSRGHRQIEHTADLALEVWAESEAALLDEAARALVEILTEGASIPPRDEVHAELDTLDPADRLVQVGNEIVYRAVTDGFVTSSLEATLREGGVSLVLRGEADASSRIKTELKSVTYHDLVLEQRDDGWFARFVIDV